MTCERPYAFFLLLLIIPAIIFIIFKNRKNSFYVKQNFRVHKGFTGTTRIFNYRRFVFFRSFFLTLGWTMLVCAYAGIYWGTNLVPVQKTGTSVSFVFDISNSMLAEDGPKGMTRLKAASKYAELLLDKIEENNLGTPVSVVVAKGDGVTAIPLTEDYTSIRSLLNAMSPSLMTVPGTSLGKGITKAKNSFPSNYAYAGRIWVFTDGEETDGHLKSALIDNIQSGIPVTIVGFGQPEESKVLTGDGVTYINSALRENQIKDTISEAQNATINLKDHTPVKYINSLDRGSASSLLAQLKAIDGQVITYEAKPVSRYTTFLLLAIIFFILAYVFMELDITKFFKDTKKTSVLMVFTLFSIVFTFTGCSKNTAQILQGTYAFEQKQYGTAVSCYLEVVKDSAQNHDEKLLSYSLYDLGTAYAKLEEYEAALDKFSQISDSAPEAIKYAAAYNEGIILAKNGKYQEAQESFKKALAIDSSKIDAKINLEVSIQKAAAEKIQASQPQTKSTPTENQDNPVTDMQEAVFERIKEHDEGKWKNSEQTQSTSSAEDY